MDDNHTADDMQAETGEGYTSDRSETRSRFSESSSDGEDSAQNYTTNAEQEHSEGESNSNGTGSSRGLDRSAASLWDQLANMDLPDLDDEDADAKMAYIVPQRMNWPTESLTRIKAEKARGYDYDRRPWSTFRGRGDGDLRRLSIRWYMREPSDKKSDKVYADSGPPVVRSSGNSSTLEVWGPSPLRKVKSTSDLSPRSSPSPQTSPTNIEVELTIEELLNAQSSKRDNSSQHFDRGQSKSSPLRSKPDWDLMDEDSQADPEVRPQSAPPVLGPHNRSSARSLEHREGNDEYDAQGVFSDDIEANADNEQDTNYETSAATTDSTPCTLIAPSYELRVIYPPMQGLGITFEPPRSTESVDTDEGASPGVISERQEGVTNTSPFGHAILEASSGPLEESAEVEATRRNASDESVEARRPEKPLPPAISTSLVRSPPQVVRRRNRHHTIASALATTVHFCGLYIFPILSSFLLITLWLRYNENRRCNAGTWVACWDEITDDLHHVLVSLAVLLMLLYARFALRSCEERSIEARHFSPSPPPSATKDALSRPRKADTLSSDQMTNIQTPTSAEELEYMTSMPSNDTARAQKLDELYKLTQSEGELAPADALHIKRQLLLYTTHGTKDLTADISSKTLQDPRVQAAWASAAAHTYRAEREKYREDREYYRSEAVRLFGELKRADAEMEERERVYEERTGSQETVLREVKEKFGKEIEVWKKACERQVPFVVRAKELERMRAEAESRGTQTEGPLAKILAQKPDSRVGAPPDIDSGSSSMTAADSIEVSPAWLADRAQALQLPMQGVIEEANVLSTPYKELRHTSDETLQAPELRRLQSAELRELAGMVEKLESVNAEVHKDNSLVQAQDEQIEEEPAKTPGSETDLVGTWQSSRRSAAYPEIADDLERQDHRNASLFMNDLGSLSSRSPSPPRPQTDISIYISLEQRSRWRERERLIKQRPEWRVIADAALERLRRRSPVSWM